MLLDDGITCHELENLQKGQKTCEEISDILSAYSLPATLEHCDFHENNLIIDWQTQKISIIDWGETVISHPFFSLAGCLWNAVYHTELTESSDSYVRLRLKCIEPWQAGWNQNDLLYAFELASQLLGIYAALGYDRLHKATGFKHLAKETGKSGAITGCLQSFLTRQKNLN